MSKGELIIENILKENGIFFQQEKSFEDLKGGKFRYDFFIPDYNGRKIVIEFNGEQHYKMVKVFQKKRKDFLSAQENDRKKISYALANGYEIYCVLYRDLGKLYKLSDVLNPMYKAADRWHNDIEYRKFLNKI